MANSISEVLSRCLPHSLWVAGAWQSKRPQAASIELDSPGNKVETLQGEESGRGNGETSQSPTHLPEEKQCGTKGALRCKTSQLLVLMLCRTPVPLSNRQSLPSACRQGCPGFDFPHLGMARNERVSFGTCPCESETQPQRGKHRRKSLAEAVCLPREGAGHILMGALRQSPQRKH